MVYRLTIDNGTPGVYQVIRNDPQNDHAEIKFIKQVENDHAEIKFIPHEAVEIYVEMFISYSPCNNCANALINWIKNLREQKKIVSIAIKFSTFYKREKNGLTLLLKEGGIILDVFFGEAAWEKFFQCSRRTDFTAFVERIRQRRERENVDYNKLRGII